MTAIVLRWRQPDPPVVTRWAGPDATVTALAASDPPQPIAAVIGPPGPGALPFACIAGEAIGGHRAVTIGADGKAYLASPIEAQAQAVFGLSTAAAAVGTGITIQTSGLLSEPSWTWTPGPVWLGAAGVLTQLLPTGGAAVLVGTAGGPTALNISPRIVARL
jgi:hypothetical protein